MGVVGQFKTAVLGRSPNCLSAQSAFVGNQAARYGGGIYNQEGALQLINSTLSTNLAQESGGGLSSFLGTSDIDLRDSR